ncbi:MAG TPA: nuclear transport factor 2 family protein [Pyrinomonadaceae bacterium]
MFHFLISVVLMSALQSATTSTDTAEGVKRLEERYTVALIKRDDAEFDQLLADDLIHIGFEGQIANKSEYMAFFKHGTWKYTKYEPSNVAIKPIGNVAVVTGRVQRTIFVNNKETTGAFAFTHVWLRTEDRWRLTSSHVTSVPNPSPATPH